MMGLWDEIVDMFDGPWGATTWAVDVDAAVLQAAEWTDTVATEKLWPEDWESAAAGIITFAAQSAGSNVEEFWSILAREWAGYDEKAFVQGIQGWDDLGEAWASAAGTAYTTSQARQDASLVGQVSDTLGQTVEDIQTAADPRKSWIPWAVGGAIALAVWVKFK
jgi:hypothetical protein